MAPKINRTLAEFADFDDKTLVIPEGLRDFSDAQVIMEYGQKAIYHKHITTGAFKAEFYTNAPCLCFVIEGKETFITSSGEEITVCAGEMIMLPRNVFMVSNFLNRCGPLEALLFFFDDSVISEFGRRSQHSSGENERIGAYKIKAHNSLTGFMNSIIDIYKDINGTRELLHTKMMELLFLVVAVDEPKRLGGFLYEASYDSGKRNIRHLMYEHQIHNLSVYDYACMAGRSVSAFNREFKRQYGVAPRKWLTEQRLIRARAAVLTTNTSITKIGFEIGYESTSHFISQFKTMYGITPKRLRMEKL